MANNNNSTRSSCNSSRSGCSSGCCGSKGCCKVNAAACRACGQACIAACNSNAQKYKELCATAQKQACATEQACCNAGNCKNITFESISKTREENQKDATGYIPPTPEEQVLLDSTYNEGVNINSEIISMIQRSLNALK